MFNEVSLEILETGETLVWRYQTPQKCYSTLLE